MTKASTKRRRQPYNPATDKRPVPNDGEEERFEPKKGPGQIFRRELIDAKSGHAKRIRNIGETPLMAAFYRGRLNSTVEVGITAEDRFAAGERFETLWTVVHRTGIKDSTVQGYGGFDGLFWTEAKQQASRDVLKISGLMHKPNYRIVVGFCGEGRSMAEALRLAGVEVHPDGTAFRIREALDDLVSAFGGGAPRRSAHRIRSQQIDPNPQTPLDDVPEPR